MVAPVSNQAEQTSAAHAFWHEVLRMPSARPQKGRQATCMPVTGAEVWAGADADFSRATAVTPAVFTWVRSIRHLVELGAIWTQLRCEDPQETWATTQATLEAHAVPQPSFVLHSDGMLTLLWGIEPFRRPAQGKPEHHHKLFQQGLEHWRWAVMKLSFALEPLGAIPLDMATAGELLTAFVPLPPLPGSDLALGAALIDWVPPQILHVAAPRKRLRVAEIAKPLRAFDDRLFRALGRAPKGVRSWQLSRVSNEARLPKGPGERHLAAVKLACAHRWDGVSQEESLTKLREWTEASCAQDGTFPQYPNSERDELLAIVQWAEKKLQVGGPTDRMAVPSRPGGKRDAAAAAVLGLLATDGEQALSIAALFARTRTWMAERGEGKCPGLRTFKRALTELIELNEIAHRVDRDGSTWRSTWSLRQPAANPESGIQKTSELRLAVSRDSQGQISQSMWVPGWDGLFDRGGFGGAFPHQGGFGGDFPNGAPGESDFGVSAEQHDVTADGDAAGDVVCQPERSAASPSNVWAGDAAELGDGGNKPSDAVEEPAEGAISANLGGPDQKSDRVKRARQRRLALGRGLDRPARRVALGPGKGLPALTPALMAELADVGGGLSQSDFRALIEEAYNGLWARPRVLNDFVGALRRKALRILRLRAFAAAAAAHVAERKARKLPPALQLDERSPADALGEFRQMLAATIKPLHERPALERLRRLHSEGLSLVVLQPASKVAVHRWREQQHYRPALRTLEQDLAGASGRDLGVVCGAISGVVVLDLDSAEDVQWAYATLPLTPWRTRTARGEHWYFQLSSTAGEPGTPWWRGDLRGHGKYVVAPGAVHPDGQRYEAIGDWSVPKRALPVWNDFPSPSGSSQPGHQRKNSARG